MPEKEVTPLNSDGSGSHEKQGQPAPSRAGKMRLSRDAPYDVDCRPSTGEVVNGVENTSGEIDVEVVGGGSDRSFRTGLPASSTFGRPSWSMRSEATCSTVDGTASGSSKASCQKDELSYAPDEYNAESRSGDPGGICKSKPCGCGCGWARVGVTCGGGYDVQPVLNGGAAPAWSKTPCWSNAEAPIALGIGGGNPFALSRASAEAGCSGRSDADGSELVGWSKKNVGRPLNK